jgi:CheY-like chemotaxis protein
VAVNGIEAVNRSARESFGLILMDVSMPEMDGIEATEVIRAREATTGGHVPIVALTAHAMHEDRVRCLAAGMDEHVTKPIVSESLLRAVERFIGPPRQGGRDQTLDPAA